MTSAELLKTITQPVTEVWRRQHHFAFSWYFENKDENLVPIALEEFERVYIGDEESRDSDPDDPGDVFDGERGYGTYLYLPRHNIDDFWLEEIQHLFHKSHHKTLTFSEVLEKGREDFAVYYNVPNEILNAAWRSKRDERYYRLKITQPVWLTGGLNSYKDLKAFLLNHKDVFEFECESELAPLKDDLLWLKGKAPQFYRQETLFGKLIAEVLYFTPDSCLPKSKLLFKCNLTDVYIGIKKPYTENLLSSTMLEFPKYFSEKNELILFNNPEEFFIEYAKKQQYKISSKFDVSNSEIPVFFEWKMGDFPMQEAKEYVGVRPIIFIGTSRNVTNLENLVENGIVAPNDELINNLRSLGISIEKMKSILKESLHYFYYEPLNTSFDLGVFRRSVIDKMLPVLNYSDNPNNLFKYTLQEKLEQYAANKGD